MVTRRALALARPAAAVAGVADKAAVGAEQKKAMKSGVQNTKAVASVAKSRPVGVQTLDPATPKERRQVSKQLSYRMQFY